MPNFLSASAGEIIAILIIVAGACLLRRARRRPPPAAPLRLTYVPRPAAELLHLDQDATEGLVPPAGPLKLESWAAHYRRRDIHLAAPPQRWRDNRRTFQPDPQQ